MDIMVDLETMGAGSDSAIVAIGAVAFDKNGLGMDFYASVDLNTSVRAGGIIEPDTVLWWLQQSNEARQALYTNVIPIDEALADFGEFVSNLGGADVKLWGNGASFDNVILANTYKRLRLPLPWKFWNDRCYRTLKSAYPDLVLPSRGGVHHNALDDAKYQAQCAIVMFNQGV